MADGLMILAGSTLDRAIAAFREGRLRARKSSVTAVRPGMCANTAERLRSINVGPISHLVEVTAESPLELFVPSAGERRSFKEYEFSVCPQEYPRGAFLEVADGILMFSPAQYYLWKCGQLDSVAKRVLLAMELCGTYAGRLPGRLDLGCEFGIEPLLDIEELRRYLELARGTRGAGPALAAAKLALGNAYSPRESVVALEQCLPVRLGGRGYPVPKLNPFVEVADDVRGLTARDSFKPDIFWDGAALDVEYDGGYHNLSEQIERDKARVADIQACGIKVISATRLSLSSFDRAELLGRQIGLALEPELGPAFTKRLGRLERQERVAERRELHAELMAATRSMGERTYVNW
jgi:hypothetical protein